MKGNILTRLVDWVFARVVEPAIERNQIKAPDMKWKKVYACVCGWVPDCGLVMVNICPRCGRTTEKSVSLVEAAKVKVIDGQFAHEYWVFKPGGG